MARRGVYVFGRFWEVRIGDDALADDYHGHADTNRRIIRISDLGNTDQAETLLHEIIHAALHESGQSETLGQDTEEALVTMLAHALAPLYGQEPEEMLVVERADT